MKLGLRLLLGFFLITGVAAFFVLRVVVDEVHPSVRDVVEDLLVDTANLLAELATDDLARMPEGGTLVDSPFARHVQDYARRPVDAQIWGLHKRSLDYRVYVTDRHGRVVFDTGSGARPGELGRDYSRWLDVGRTLKGQYGARATREVLEDDRTAVLFVAAPVRRDGALIGVLTVAKPMSTVQPFIARAQGEILRDGAWLLGLSVLVGVGVTAWVVRSVRRLRDYAQRVQFDRLLPAPALSGELGELARAMEAMQVRLAGHEHVEQLMRAFTHELKSPLTAIGGAAELLQDDLPAADRVLFAGQIQDQSARLRQLVERLLELSRLEHHPRIEAQPLELVALVERALAVGAARAVQAGVTLEWTPSAGEVKAVWVRGEAELLALALNNLLDNAVDFSPVGVVVSVVLTVSPEAVWLSVRDHGPGVPAYALARLGERFYSTPRPAPDGQPGRKGTGLGLAIVRQVMVLHGGRLDIANAEPGLRATLVLPRG